MSFEYSEESLLPYCYYYYYYLGDERRIFMTKYYLKSARNFTIHQPSEVHRRIVIISSSIHHIMYNEKRSEKIKGIFFDYHPSSSSSSSSRPFFDDGRKWDLQDLITVNFVYIGAKNIPPKLQIRELCLSS